MNGCEQHAPNIARVLTGTRAWRESDAGALGALGETGEAGEASAARGWEHRGGRARKQGRRPSERAGASLAATLVCLHAVRKEAVVADEQRGHPRRKQRLACAEDGIVM